MARSVNSKRRISRLPKVLRSPARLIRNVTRRRPVYGYENDGIATTHFSPFLHDREFDELYWEVEADWFPGWRADVRWRMWILTRFARSCDSLSGAYAEFGAYRGGAARLVLSTARLDDTSAMHLFDTFGGIPAQGLTPGEERLGFAGRYSNTSAEYVAELLSPWREFVHLHKGDVLETLPEVETGPLAFVHMDLNATAPTIAALEYSYSRLLPGGTIVFDDYGGSEYEDQRHAIDHFFEHRAEEPIALPTGQAVIAKNCGE